MVYSFVVAALALVAAPALVVADMGRPVLFSNGLHDPLVAFDTIKSSGVSSTRDSSVPQQCKDFGQYDGSTCDINNFETREVFYEDCDQSWILCRCPDAQMSMDQLQERLGQVPVGIRSYVGVAIATAQDSCSAVTINGQWIRFQGDCPVSVFLHESGHAIDDNFSAGQPWVDAINNDTCVPDGYANTNPVEDFAQVMVMYTYEKQFGPVPGDRSCLQHQWDLIVPDTRINEAQETKTCVKDKRDTLTNDKYPTPAETTVAPPPPPPSTSTSSDPAPTPDPSQMPPTCKSAKFRFARRAMNVARAAANKIKSITVPFGL